MLRYLVLVFALLQWDCQALEKAKKPKESIFVDVGDILSEGILLREDAESPFFRVASVFEGRARKWRTIDRVRYIKLRDDALRLFRPDQSKSVSPLCRRRIQLTQVTEGNVPKALELCLDSLSGTKAEAFIRWHDEIQKLLQSSKP